MVSAMKEAGNVLKEKFAAPEMDIDAILDMQDDMAEILEESNEINEVMGQDYGVGEGMEDDDLMAELDMLGDEMMNEDTSYLNDIQGIPNLNPNPNPNP